MDSQLPNQKEGVIVQSASSNVRKGFFAYSTVFLLCLGASAAQAATYYISTSGSDTNPGTSAAPFQTIGRTCSGLLKPGDTVIVEDGVYNVFSPKDGCDVSESGTSSGWITFEAEHKWGAKLNGNNNSSALGFYLSANAFIRIKDFEIYGFSGAGITIDNGTPANAGNNIEITGNNIHNIGRMCTDTPYGGDGIFVGTYSNTILIDKNLIHDIGRYAPGQNGCEPATTYYTNHDHGVYLDGVNGITVVNNVFYNNNSGWDVQFWDDPGPPLTSNALIANNTFASHNPYRNGQIILGYPGATNTTIENNIFNLPPTGGIWLYSAENPIFSNINVSNNIVNGGTINSGTAAGVAFTNNMANTNPNLVNANMYDFHLQMASPAVNAGVNIPQVTDDFDGNARPNNSAYDIGAYEYPGATFYGAGLGADTSVYTAIGGAATQMVSYRFLNFETDMLSSISWYQQVGALSGYSAGTNGKLQVQIETDDGTAAHNPSGKVLASGSVSSFCNGIMTGSCPVTLAFSPLVSLQAGTLYHLVFSNIDPNPAKNYSSISALYYPSSSQPSVSGTNWAELMYTPATGWAQQSGFTPIIQFFFADGTITGHTYGSPYVQWAQNISGSSSVREQFTVSGSNQQANAVSLRLALSSGKDPLTVTLEEGNGTVLEQESIPASAVPSHIVFNPFSAGNWALPQWIVCPFKLLHTLSVGQTYYLVLSAPATSVYNIFPMEKGTLLGFNTATNFSDGFAQFNSGSGWTGWPLGGSLGNASDLQFYLTMRSTGQGVYNLQVSPAGSGFGMVFGSNNLINCGVNPGATVCDPMVYSGTAVTLTAVPASGSTFTGWGVSGSPAGTCMGLSSPCTLTVNANTVVTANFNSRPPEILTVSSKAGGTISPSGTVDINYGANQLFTLTPGTGYNATLKVDGTVVALTNNTYTLTDVIKKHTIKATFSLQTEAINVIVGTGGTVTPSSMMVNYGATKTFGVKASKGYTTSLTDNGVAEPLKSNQYTLTNITGSHTLRITFSN